jgi:hypothetical protein
VRISLKWLSCLIADNHYFSDFVLKSTPDIRDGNFVQTKFGYAMRIKEHTQSLNEVDGYLPFMTYLWVGGRFPPTQIVGGEEVVHPQAGQPEWCFAYGEEDWVRGVNFASAKNQTRRIRLGIPDDGDIDYEVDCQ